jgi:hypothetical protein
MACKGGTGSVLRLAHLMAFRRLGWRTNDFLLPTNWRNPIPSLSFTVNRGLCIQCCFQSVVMLSWTKLPEPTRSTQHLKVRGTGQHTKGNHQAGCRKWAAASGRYRLHLCCTSTMFFQEDRKWEICQSKLERSGPFRCPGRGRQPATTNRPNARLHGRRGETENQSPVRRLDQQPL